MKKLMLGIAAASMTLVSGAALAQPYGAAYGYHRNHGYNQGYMRDSDRDGRPDRQEWNRDRDRDGRPDQYDRYDNRRGYNNSYRGAYNNSYRGDYGWRQGQVYPYYQNRGYYISDYRAYRLPPPRPGYRYYRTDNGDVVMAAIASGLIGLVIGGALNNNNSYGYNNGYYGY